MLVAGLNMNILLCISIAFIFGLLSTKLMKIFNLPNVTGFLIAGLVIGPSILGFVSSDDLNALSFISDIALGFIAFSIGVEFKLRHLKEIGGNIVITNKSVIYNYVIRAVSTQQI